MAHEENNTERTKDPLLLRHWRSWGSWYSWGSPVGLGLGLFLAMTGFGLMIWLLSGGGGVTVFDAQ